MGILELIQQESGIVLRKATVLEYKGACPFCKTGDDRFCVWPKQGRYWCRICGKSGDDIQFIRDYKHLSFVEAQGYLGKGHDCYDVNIHNNHNNHNGHTVHINNKHTPQTPPSMTWSDTAWQFVFACQAELMEGDTNPKALAWLHSRGLLDETLWKYGLGYHSADVYIDREAWGLEPVQDDKGRDKKLWLPRGIVMPWVIGGDLWGIRIRRPVGEPKYYFIPGGTPSLYNADTVSANKPVVLVEGEFDALTILQVAGDIASTVATGGTQGARRIKWIARLATASMVLVAYDTDDAGEKASSFWLDALPNAKRWRPYWGDANSMAQDGADVRRWAEMGATSLLTGKQVA